MKSSSSQQGRSESLMMYVASRYTKRGWDAYARNLDGYPGIPGDVPDPKPDLFLLKGDDRCAVVIGSDTVLNDPATPERWAAIGGNVTKPLVIIVRNGTTLKRANRLIRGYGLNAECRVIKHRSGGSSGGREGRLTANLKKMSERLKWYDYVVLLVVALMSLYVAQRIVTRIVPVKTIFMKVIGRDVPSYRHYERME